MRALRFFLPVFVALAIASPALASGPVFVVVPTTPAEAQASASTSTSLPGNRPDIERNLRADHMALARARHEVRRTRAAASRARQATVSAQSLSSWLEADKQSVQLGVAAESAVARRDGLEKSIAELETELQATQAPAFDPMLPASAAPNGAEAVSIAEQYLGVPYRWGGSSPAEGFDCSGLTMYVYAQLGIALPHYAAAQWSEGVQVDPSSLEPGDLVFFEPGLDGPGHVAIFVGGDQIIEAPHTGDVVKLASLSATAGALGFVGAVRPASALASLFP